MGERERVAPLSPPVTRGCRGAERPTLVSSETKAVRRTACIVGNEYPHQNSSGRAREGRSPLAPVTPRGCRGAEHPTPASSETKAVRRTACVVGNEYPHQNSSGRAREGRTPLAPRHPRGCRGAERPTLAPSGTKVLKRTACFVGNQFLHQNSPGELERV